MKLFVSAVLLVITSLAFCVRGDEKLASSPRPVFAVGDRVALKLIDPVSDKVVFSFTRPVADDGSFSLLSTNGAEIGRIQAAGRTQAAVAANCLFRYVESLRFRLLAVSLKCDERDDMQDFRLNMAVTPIRTFRKDRRSPGDHLLPGEPPIPAETTAKKNGAENIAKE